LLQRYGGNVGIGTGAPTTQLAIVGSQSKNPAGTQFPFGIRTNDAPVNNPFGMEISITGSPSLAFRSVNFQTSDLNLATGGTIALQPAGGFVGVGTATPSNQLTIVVPLAKTTVGAGYPFAMRTNDSPSSNPFGYEVELTGAASNANRSVGFQTSDLNLINGGNLLFQRYGGNVGVGTATPGSKFEVIASSVDQAVKVTQAGGGTGSFSIGAPPPAAIHGDTIASSGFVSGVFGTTSSTDGFGVLGENLASGQGTGHSAGVRGITANTTALGTGVWGDALQSSGDNAGVFGHSASTAGTGVEGFADATTGDAVGVYGRSDSSSGTGVFGEATAGTAVASGSLMLAGVYGKIAANGGAAGLFDTTGTGDILIGRAGGSPVNKFRVDSTGKMFANGGTATSGADFAESVSILDERSTYQPGDVMAIDTGGVRRFTKVSKSYSTLVAGIYSTKPGVLATPHVADDPRHETEEIPLAMVGIVPCKVTSENGPISAGDLLVSSSTSGYAMKGTDRSRMTGAVIGKALQSMHEKNGVIEVLVSLQ
jgi:hypothetical protein